jgi:hypothetical protein
LITYNPEAALLMAGYSKEEADRLNHAVFLDPLWRELDRGTYRSMKEALPLFVKAHPQDQALIQNFFSKDWMKILFQPIEESVVFMKKGRICTRVLIGIRLRQFRKELRKYA